MVSTHFQYLLVFKGIFKVKLLIITVISEIFCQFISSIKAKIICINISQMRLQSILKLMIDGLTPHIIVRRQINDTDYVNNLKPTFQRQKNSESESSEDSMDSEKSDDERNSNQELDSEMDSVEDDFDETEGDGQGGGILGLLAGLSGGVSYLTSCLYADVLVFFIQRWLFQKVMSLNPV